MNHKMLKSLSLFAISLVSVLLPQNINSSAINRRSRSVSPLGSRSSVYKTRSLSADRKSPTIRGNNTFLPIAVDSGEPTHNAKGRWTTNLEEPPIMPSSHNEVKASLASYNYMIGNFKNQRDKSTDPLTKLQLQVEVDTFKLQRQHIIVRDKELSGSGDLGSYRVMIHLLAQVKKESEEKLRLFKST